jgi:hypothetical protein
MYGIRKSNEEQNSFCCRWKRLHISSPNKKKQPLSPYSCHLFLNLSSLCVAGRGLPNISYGGGWGVEPIPITAKKIYLLFSLVQCRRCLYTASFTNMYNRPVCFVSPGSVEPGARSLSSANGACKCRCCCHQWRCCCCYYHPQRCSYAVPT